MTSLGSSDDHTDSDADDEADPELDSSTFATNDTSPAHSHSAIRFRVDVPDSSERQLDAAYTSSVGTSTPQRAANGARRSARERFSLSKREFAKHLYERFERLLHRASDGRGGHLPHSRTQPLLVRLSSETDTLLTELAGENDVPGDECVSFERLSSSSSSSSSVPEHLRVLFKSIRCLSVHLLACAAR